MNLREIYRKSVHIALRNKTLWIIGMALVAFSGGGLNFSQSFQNFGDFSEPSSFFEGVADGNTEQVLSYLKSLAAAIPKSVWVSLGIAVVLAVIIGFIFSLIARNWAKGSLIGGINEAYEGRPVSLKSSSEHGFKNLKSLIWLNIIPWLLYTLVLLIVGVFIFLLSTVMIPLAAILGIVVGIFAVIAGLAISATQIWAVRVVVIEGKPAKESFFEGWYMVKKHLIKMLTLGCLNSLISCCVGCVVMSAILPAIAVIVGMFAVSPTLGLALIVPIALIGLPILFLTLLFNGIYRVFNYSTWNILYRQVRQEESYGQPTEQQQ